MTVSASALGSRQRHGSSDCLWGTATPGQLFLRGQPQGWGWGGSGVETPPGPQSCQGSGEPTWLCSPWGCTSVQVVQVSSVGWQVPPGHPAGSLAPSVLSSLKQAVLPSAPRLSWQETGPSSADAASQPRQPQFPLHLAGPAVSLFSNIPC